MKCSKCKKPFKKIPKNEIDNIGKGYLIGLSVGLDDYKGKKVECYLCNICWMKCWGIEKYLKPIK